MRFISALKNDMHYQMKYGFYFLYAFISAVYVAVLLIIPDEYKKTAASIIILTDPTMLGLFFIGGIWLLEKREGLHGFCVISPLCPIEYILSKAVSLSIVSTLSALLIVLFGIREAFNFFVISFSVFIGSMIFTIIGMITASYARSVNQYVLIASPPAVFLTLPGILAAFGVSYIPLEIVPGTALWRMIAYSLGIIDKPVIWLWIVFPFWFCIVLYLANKRIPNAMQIEGSKI